MHVVNTAIEAINFLLLRRQSNGSHRVHRVSYGCCFDILFICNFSIIIYQVSGAADTSVTGRD